MMPFLPPVKMWQSGDNRELSEFLTMAHGPTSKEFHEMVFITLFLRQTLGNFGVVILSAGTIFREMAYRNNGVCLAFVIRLTVKVLSFVGIEERIIVSDRAFRNQSGNMLEHLKKTLYR